MASVPCLRSVTSAARAALRASSPAFFIFSLDRSCSMSKRPTHPPSPSHNGYWIRRISAPRTTPRIFICASSPEPGEGLAAGIAHRVAEVLLDPQQLVVLGDALRARQRSGLDLQRIGAHRDIGDGGVLGLARAVRDHRAVAGALGELDRGEGLRQGADLVHLYQDRVGDALLDALAEDAGVGDEDVVADQLQLLAQAPGQRLPAFPVVLR